MKFWDYIKGDRKGPQAHRTEMEAMRDPLLDDAIEGYDKVSGDHDAALERLRSRIAARAELKPTVEQGHRSQPAFRWMAAAAVALVCLTVGTWVFVLDREPFTQPLIALDTTGQNDSLPGAETDKPSPIAAVTGQLPKQSREGVTKQQEKARVVVITEKPNLTNAGPKLEIVEDALRIIEDDMVVESIELAFADEEYASQKQEAQLSSPLPDDIAETVVGKGADKPVRRSVTGRVVEAGTGEPITGAQVKIEGGVTGAVTDLEGFFELPDTEQDARIIARFLGYEEIIMPADTGRVMLIAMAPENQTVDEVVVVAYGTGKKSSYTGNVAAMIVPDTTTTAQFRSYLSAELAALAANEGLEGIATLDFEVNSRGRPQRIKEVKGSSPEALREARRILLGGPDWEPSQQKRRITIVFGQ